MKKINVVCNPVTNKIQFPAEIKYFYADDTAIYEKKIEEWAKKNGKIIISIDTERVIEQTMDAIKGERL